MSLIDDIKNKHINLSIHEEKELIAEYKKTKNPALREKLIRSKYALAIRTAHKYACEKYSFEDAFSDAITGVCMAIEKHDESRGPFRLACGIYIRVAIITSMNKYTKLIYMASYHNKGVYIKEALEEYAQTGDLKAISKKYGFLPQTILGNAVADSVNASNMTGIENARSEYESHHDIMERAEIISEIRLALRIFPVRERKIIKMRYGLDGYEQMTVIDIARIVGVSKQRVFQICDKAMRTLAERFPWMREYLR